MKMKEVGSRASEREGRTNANTHMGLEGGGGGVTVNTFSGFARQ